MAGKNSASSNHVVMFPGPFQGHVTPMLHLAGLLHAHKGFSVTIIHAKFNSPDSTRYPDFNFISIDDQVFNIAANENSGLVLLGAINANCASTFCEAMTQLMESVVSPVSCVVIDSLLYEVQEAARRRLNLPVISLRTSGVACFNAFQKLPILLEKGYFPVRDYSEPELEVPELHPLRVRDLPDIDGSTPELIQVAASMINAAEKASAIIFNSCEHLEGSQIKICEQISLPNTPVFAVGPLHKFSPDISTTLLEQDPTCVEWLDQQAPNSVIYVSFGSLASMKEEEILETAYGLLNSEQPFIWVVREDASVGLPASVREEIQTYRRNKIVKWACQVEVLKHPSTGAFWTHCGWNSTVESVCEGVPMLCSPCFGDQMVNARYVSHVWKVGVELEKIERGEIEKCVRRLFIDEEMKQRGEELKQSALLCLLKQGGSSYKMLDKLVYHIQSLHR